VGGEQLDRHVKRVGTVPEGTFIDSFDSLHGRGEPVAVQERKR